VARDEEVTFPLSFKDLLVFFGTYCMRKGQTKVLFETLFTIFFFLMQNKVPIVYEQ
jgi:hypothetical protein